MERGARPLRAVGPHRKDIMYLGHSFSIGTFAKLSRVCLFLFYFSLLDEVDRPYHPQPHQRLCSDSVSSFLVYIEIIRSSYKNEEDD